MLDTNAGLARLENAPAALPIPENYVFIVGLPRTGTTLLRSLLNVSKDVAIGMGESHYLGGPRLFGLLRRPGFGDRLSKVGDLSTEAGVRKIAAFLYEARQNNFWSAISTNIDREMFLQQLLQSDWRERALFELAMIGAAGGKRWGGEKTPDHLYAVPTLLEWFPNARILHTFRDPRAVYVSNKRKYDQRNAQGRLHQSSARLRRLGLMYEWYASSEVILAWRRAIRLHRRYQAHYPGQYLLSRYEDLILDPQAHLQKLCRFLNITFSDGMLNQTFTNSSFVPRNQVQGFDRSAIDRWRNNLHPLIGRWFVRWCRAQLLEFGYPI